MSAGRGKADGAGSGFVDARRGGERTGTADSGADTSGAGGTAATVLFCESDSGEGACTPRSTVGECDTVARCGAGTSAGGIVVVAVADLDRFVAICSGRIGDRGGESGADDENVVAASSRLPLVVSGMTQCMCVTIRTLQS